MISKRERDRVIEVSATIKRLRDELAIAERELDALLSGDSAHTEVSGDCDGANLTQRVLEFLNTDRIRTVTPEIVTDHLRAAGSSTVSAPTVRSTLHRLATDGKILRVQRGAYKALDEPPGLVGTPTIVQSASEAAE